MDGIELRSTGIPEARRGNEAERWKYRYADTHRLIRITDFPAKVAPPKKVRIYSRHRHFLLQAWDPALGKTVYQRVEGDLIDVLAKARELDQRLADFKSTGFGHGKITHEELVRLFSEDLDRRADAGQIAPATPRRFRSALGHYLRFVALSQVATKYSQASLIDRQFALSFSAYLEGLQISPNGQSRTPKRRMAGQGFVLDTVRGMFQWAADPQRGNCLPPGFINPFNKRLRNQRHKAPTLFGEPDITMPMATAFLRACDEYQLRLFAPMLLYGLRAAEPVFLFGEFIGGGWLRVRCIPELDFLTKGSRDKQFPLLPEVERLLVSHGQPTGGLLFTGRAVAPGAKNLPLMGRSLEQVIREYQQRCVAMGAITARQRIEVRANLMRQAGALTYKVIQGEFAHVAGSLQWPKSATTKDLRHLFATALANGGMPEHERQYLMGHSTGTAAILHYTHLNQIREHYQRAVQSQMGPILEIVRQRLSTMPK